MATQMCKRQPLYFILLLSLTFAACKKENIDAGNDYQTLGTSAHNILAAAPYSSLSIEIEYMPGYEPDNSSLNGFKNFLNQYLNKPNGINIVAVPIPASGKTTLTLNDIESIEKKSRTVFTGNSKIAIYILIADANFDESTILAKSYWNTSICVFGKTVSDNSGGSGQITRSQLLTILLEHEFGHLIGLVNQGSPMQTNHQDVSNGAHCINESCLMHYHIVTSAISPTSPLPTLDANCIADLRANGGK
jgi:hypothetical protein